MVIGMKDREQKKCIIAGLLLVAVLGMLVISNILWGEHWIDSDMAAEMIFSKLLADNGNFLATRDWYYSTEFRVLYTQIFMVPLFHIFGSWHVIRVITNVMTYLLMLTSYFYFMKPFRFRKSTVMFTSVILLLPFSETFVTHMQFGNTYMFHVIILLLTFGLFLRLAQAGKGWNAAKVVNLVCFVLLSVVCGLSGVRYLLALQAPMGLAAVFYACTGKSAGEVPFRKLREELSLANVKAWMSAERLSYLVYSVIGAGFAVIGYGLNVVVLGKIFTFQMYDSTNFIKIFQGVLVERTQDTIGNLLMLFGYIEEKGFLSLRGLISLIAFGFLGGILFLTLRCRKLLRENAVTEAAADTMAESHKRLIYLFFVIAFCLNTFVFLFATGTIVSRYYITVFLFVLPLLAVFYEKETLPLDRLAVTVLLCGALTLTTAKCMFSMIDKDKNGDKKQVVAYLVEQGYGFGYSTYWNGNIMTELSDGKLEVANIHDVEQMDLFTWSSPKKYYEKNYCSGKTYLILTFEEADTFKTAASVNRGREIYRQNGYVVLHYDSVEELFGGTME